MRIKSSYVIVFCLVVFVIAMVPLIDGILFKKSYLHFLSTLAADNKTSIEVLEYRTGWLSSHTKIHMTSTQNTSEKGLLLEQDISHGPLAYDAMNHTWVVAKALMQTYVDVPAEMTELFGNQLSKSTIHINTQVAFSGDYKNQISVSPVAIRSPYGNVNWGGLQGKVSFGVADQHINRTSMNLVIGSIQIQNTEHSFMMNEITLRTHITHPSDGVLGEMECTVSTPEIIHRDLKDTMTFTNVSAKMSATADTKDFFNESFEFTLGKLTTPRFTSNADVNLSINHLSTKGFFDLINGVQQFKNGIVTQEQWEIYNALMLGLITPTTAVKSRLNIMTSFGNFFADLQANWPEATLPMKSIADLTHQTRLQVNLRVSASVINQLVGIEAAQQADAFAKLNPSVENKTVVVKEDSTQLLEKLSQQGTVPLDVAIQLKDLQARNLAPDVYAQNIQPFVLRKEISPEIAEKIKAQYVEDKRTDNTPSKLTQVSVGDMKLRIEQDMHKRLDDVIKNGYLIQAQEEYLATVRYEQGLVTINGKDTAGLLALLIPTQPVAVQPVVAAPPSPAPVAVPAPVVPPTPAPAAVVPTPPKKTSLPANVPVPLPPPVMQPSMASPVPVQSGH